MYINKKTLKVANDEMYLKDYKGKKDWFHCDDLLVPPILELNRKGYITARSRIGAPSIIQNIDNKTICICDEVYNEISIVFEAWVKIDKLPMGWYSLSLIDIRYGKVLRSPKYDTYDFTYYDNYKHKIDKLGLLMSWIESLPNYEDVITDECKAIREFFNYVRSDKAYKEFKERYITEGKVENHNNTRLFRSIYDDILYTLQYSGGVYYKKVSEYERLYYNTLIPFYIKNAKNTKHQNLQDCIIKCRAKTISQICNKED